MRFVSPPPSPRSSLVLTRRGRLLRTGLALLITLMVVIALVAGARALSGGRSDETVGTLSAAPDAGSGGGSDAAADAGSGGGSGSASDAGTAETATSATAQPTADENTSEAAPEIVRSGTVGAGTWTTPDLVDGSDPGTLPVHTYAVRVEAGIGIDADDAAQEIARILDDERGWRATEEVAFEHVADPASAEFTISIASPPTADELCLPARTNGLWSCRVGEDVVLNSDRWLHRTPTYSDTTEYRAYMVNHEIGHFLGHGHSTCGGDGLTAPVMLQQSIDLGGCRPNAWPTSEGMA